MTEKKSFKLNAKYSDGLMPMYILLVNVDDYSETAGNCH